MGIKKAMAALESNLPAAIVGGLVTLPVSSYFYEQSKSDQVIFERSKETKELYSEYEKMART